MILMIVRFNYELSFLRRKLPAELFSKIGDLTSKLISLLSLLG